MTKCLKCGTKKCLHHIFGGFGKQKSQMILVTREEHEAMHKGAIVHDLSSYYPSISLNLAIRQLAWIRRWEISNEPEKVQFT